MPTTKEGKVVLTSFKDRYTKVFNTIESDTFRRGFSRIDMWADTGNYALNRLLSNRYDRAFLYGRFINVYGESGSGKSLLLAQTGGIEQRQRNAFVVWIDVENSTDDTAGEKWLQQAGIDTNHNFDFISLATIDDAQALVSNFAAQYRRDINDFTAGKLEEKPQPVFFIFDSASALLTDTQWEHATKGKTKGDQGQKAKQLGDFILKSGHLVRGLPILISSVFHVYDNQQVIQGRPVGGKHKMTGGNKAVYMASQALLLTKKMLRDGDDDSDDGRGKVIGITSVAKIMKSRFSKPFEMVNIDIPYESGIDPYSGLFDLMLMEGTITSPSQSWYAFTRADGSVKKFQKKNFSEYADEIMTLPIAEGKVGIDLPKELQVEVTPEEQAALAELEEA